MRLIFKINWYWILILPLTIQIEMLYGQASPLDRYIREAFASSPMLYQSDLEVEKSKLVKDFARSYYFPTASIQMGYQTAAGGRNIDLPVGDMLNGVYSTLNQITGTSSSDH
jgi:outer membrane protein TolC